MPNLFLSLFTVRVVRGALLRRLKITLKCKYNPVQHVFRAVMQPEQQPCVAGGVKTKLFTRICVCFGVFCQHLWSTGRGASLADGKSSGRHPEYLRDSYILIIPVVKFKCKAELIRDTWPKCAVNNACDASVRLIIIIIRILSAFVVSAVVNMLCFVYCCCCCCWGSVFDFGLGVFVAVFDSGCLTLFYWHLADYSGIIVSVFWFLNVFSFGVFNK